MLTDFGLAHASDDISLTCTGYHPGTPQYMSPEQARGEPADHRSDIFSLGVVIYEMATGRLPFERHSEAETLTAVVNEPHAPAAEASPALSAVIDRALAKAPADRYPSMESMLEALKRC